MLLINIMICFSEGKIPKLKVNNAKQIFNATTNTFCCSISYEYLINYSNAPSGFDESAKVNFGVNHFNKIA